MSNQAKFITEIAKHIAEEQMKKNNLIGEMRVVGFGDVDDKARREIDTFRKQQAEAEARANKHMTTRYKELSELAVERMLTPEEHEEFKKLEPLMLKIGGKSPQKPYNPAGQERRPPTGFAKF